MKRSRSIRLVLMGSISAVALAACDDAGNQNVVEKFFQDEAQCTRESNDSGACRQALADARAAHQSTAPAFTNQAACEAQFGAGNCGPAEVRPSPQQVAAGEGEAAARSTTSHGGGFFMPLLLGYTMGRMLGGGGAAGMPVWRDARNTAFVGGRPAGAVDPQAISRARATGTPVQVARGGFGTSAVGSSTS